MTADAASVGAAEAAGRRLHPLGLFVGLFRQLPQLFVPIAAALYGARGSGIGSAAIVAAVLLASVLFRVLGWMRFRYYLGEDDVRIESGLFSRSARSIPYDRIQDVSIEQNAIARLCGLAEVKFETGGGAGEEAKLSFVSSAEAERLRDVVRAQKGGAAQIGAEAQPEAAAAQVPVFAMDNRRLLVLGFYSFSLVILAVLGGLAQQLDFLLPFDFWDIRSWIGLAETQGMDVAHIDYASQLWGAVLGLAVLVLAGIATGIIRTFLTDYGFRLDRTAQGFRRRRGLFTRTDVVMPVARVQAAQIGTGPVRKRRGWYTLQFISLASDTSKQSHHMVAPLARLGEIWPIAAEAGLRPPADDLPFEAAHPAPWIDRWLAGMVLLSAATIAALLDLGRPGWLILLLAVPLSVVLWLGWRHHSDALDADQIYARHGWWNQQLDLARQVNVQSVTILQGPLMRARGLARLEFGIAGGSLAFVSLPLAIAQEIRSKVLALMTPVDYSQLGRIG